MKRRSIALVFIAAVLVLPPILFPSASARAQGPAVASAAPRIERFDIDPPGRLVPGEALIFRISGSSGGAASVRIGGVKGKLALPEVMTGIYEGAYTIKAGDEIGVDSLVIGSLRHGNQELSAVLGQPLVEHSAVASAR